MTLRESKIFKYCKKDIYELTGDYIKYSNRKFYSYLDSFKRYVSDKCNKIKKTPSYSNLVVLDVDEIRRRDFELAKRLYNESLVKYITRFENYIDIPELENYVECTFNEDKNFYMMYLIMCIVAFTIF